MNNAIHMIPQGKTYASHENAVKAAQAMIDDFKFERAPRVIIATAGQKHERFSPVFVLTSDIMHHAFAVASHGFLTIG